MSYDLTGNPDTIYVPVDKTSPSMAIVVVFCIFFLIAFFCGMYFLRRFVGMKRRFPGMPLDGRTKMLGVATLAGAVMAALALGLYAVNPFYRIDQQNAAQLAIEDISERYGLTASWEFAPYNPFGEDDTRVGRLFIHEGGVTYPTRLSPTVLKTHTTRGTKTRTDNVTLVVEVKVNGSWMPISDFTRQVAGHEPRY